MTCFFEKLFGFVAQNLLKTSIINTFGHILFQKHGIYSRIQINSRIGCFDKIFCGRAKTFL